VHGAGGNPEDSYYGLHATTDVYGHELKRGQLSHTGIWVYHIKDANYSSYNAISVGWHVRKLCLLIKYLMCWRLYDHFGSYDKFPRKLTM
jgi:hypothetical protein